METPGRRGLRALAGAAAVVCVLAHDAIAQSPTTGTVQLSAATGFAAGRQAIPSRDDQGVAGVDDAGLTSVLLGFEGTYFLSPRVGIGGLVSYQRVAADPVGGDSPFDASAGLFGLLVRIRQPLDDRTAFVLIGSGGGVSVGGVGQPLGAPDETAPVHGRYWLIGGAVSVAVNARVSLDLGARYQSSAFTPPGTELDRRVTAAGLVLGAGFSLYLR